MDVEISLGQAASAEAPAAPAEAAAPAAPAAPVTVLSAMKIDGVQRDVVRTTIGDRVIVHTRRLTVLEQKLLSRVSDPRDEGKVAGLYNYAAATVRQIDGDAIGFPNTDAQINAIITRMGDPAAEYLVRYLQASTAAIQDDAKN